MAGLDVTMLITVMAELDPAIHVFAFSRQQDVDARDKRGHDGVYAAVDEEFPNRLQIGRISIKIL